MHGRNLVKQFELILDDDKYLQTWWEFSLKDKFLVTATLRSCLACVHIQKQKSLLLYYIYTADNVFKCCEEIFDGETVLILMTL